MRRGRCESCGQEFPLNETVSVLDHSYCQPCAEKALEGRDDISQEAVSRNHDPTVCAECGHDNGCLELGRLADVPVCPDCESKYRRRPFPLWVKIGMLAVLSLAGFELARNWRLLQACFEIPRASAAADRGDFETAAQLAEQAAAHLPEYPHLKGEAAMLRAIWYIQQGQAKQAIALLESEDVPAEARDGLLRQAHINLALQEDRAEDALRLIEDYKRSFPQARLDDLRLAAEISMAFRNRDYNTFLALARKNLDQARHQAHAMAGVASALACKYAETGDDSFRREAEDYLQQAQRAAPPHEMASLKEYCERIEHRLRSREVIDKKEYDRRYRGGDEGGKAQ
jgi:tetratricopeptide (TPR) repeat protein